MATETMWPTWGARVRNRRTARGMSLIRLSRVASVDQGSLSKIERGLRYPSDEVRLRIAIALETTHDDLFGWPKTVAGTAALAGLAPAVSQDAA